MGIRILLTVASLVVWSQFVPAAAAFPDRSLRVIVGFAPGGLGDIVSRLLADAIAVRVGGPRIVVENRTGANGMIALETVARSAADGYTVLQCGTGIMTVSPVMPGLQLPVDIARDIAPIANVVSNSWALAVSPRSAFWSLADLVSAARQRPRAVSYGHAGVGSLQHLAVEWFASEAGIELLGVPYRGMGPAVVDLMGDRIDIVLTSLGDVSRQASEGQVRVLGLAEPAASLQSPETPRLSATVPGYELVGWSGLCGPQRLPAEAMAWWQSAVSRALDDPAFRERLTQVGMTPGYEDAATFAGSIDTARERWRRVIERAGIRAE
ncbi:MAG: tripartite tricarboxylate transporter family receptor [Rubritepida sp.]|nr:tripartite tricarboxylate transporter family receptor [Rubritepida sp.]